MTKQNHTPRVWPLILVALAVIGIGTVFYHVTENLSFVDALYFSTITLTTIGYGDIVPTTDFGKIFTVFYVLIGIALIAGIANYVLRHALVTRWEHRQEHHDSKKH